MNRALGLMVARGWMNICAIASFLIVGRFLSPTEFGIYALASSAILLPMTLIGAGYSDHVISRDHEKKDEATAFWSTAGLGLAFALLALAAGLVLQKVGFGDIGRVLTLLSPLPLMWGSSAIMEAMLIRDNRAGLMAGISVSAETLGLAALLVSVLMGAGVLSLVFSRLVNNAILLVIYFILVRAPSWRRVNRDAATRLTKFSLGVIGARVMNWADAYGVEFIIGALLPTALVGFYRMAGRLNAAMGSILIFAPWQAQLAYLGERLTAAPHRGGVAVLRALQLHMSLIAPLFVGLAGLADDVIGVLLGPNWAPAAGVLTFMSIGAVTQVIYGVLVAVLIAGGKTRQLFYFQVAIVAGTTAALALGATWGLQGAALAKFAMAGACYISGLLLLVELSARQRARLLTYLAALALACSALALAMLLAAQFLPQGETLAPRLIRIAACALAGLGAYLAALRVLAPDAARLLVLTVRKRLRGRRRRR